MALSTAEKQRRYRERQKDAAKNAPDLSASVIRRPFHKFIAGWHVGLEENLDAVGIHISGSLEDEVQTFETEANWDEFDTPGIDVTTSLGRATVMVGALFDAAQELAQVISEFKLEEIDARLAEIERADLSDPATKKQALADIVRLTDIRKRLDRDVRHSLRQIQVKGE